MKSLLHRGVHPRVRMTSFKLTGNHNFASIQYYFSSLDTTLQFTKHPLIIDIIRMKPNHPTSTWTTVNSFSTCGVDKLDTAFSTGLNNTPQTLLRFVRAPCIVA